LRGVVGAEDWVMAYCKRWSSWVLAS
jgi:hypothetical protein